MWTSLLLLALQLLSTQVGCYHREATRELHNLQELLYELRELDETVDVFSKGLNTDNDLSNIDYTSESDLKRWLAAYNKEGARQANILTNAAWDYATDITEEHRKRKDDTEVEMSGWEAAQYKMAQKFNRNKDDFKNSDLLRQLQTLINNAPLSLGNEKQDRKMAELTSQMETIFSTSVVNYDGKMYRLDPDIETSFAESRDYDKLLYLWWGWRNATGPQSKPLYIERTKLETEVVQNYGFTDVGNYWRRKNYFADDIKPMVDKLFQQIKPLYEQVHAYVRRKLIQIYPGRNISPTGPIPAHLLGNMWAQQWNNIYPDVAPFSDVPLDDIVPNMVAQEYDALRMFKTAESFFTSLGLEPMTEKFWKRSMIVRPKNREVVCHGAAEDFMTDDDFRIKMCTKLNQEDLTTVHHEMGHIEYFMQYRHQPYLYRTGANSAFHEAIGDTIALSVMTPGHMETIGLLEKDSSENPQVEYKKDINFLMKMALTKVAFLPFGLMIDKYRWDVFDGTIDNSNLNTKWWEYRKKYQGVEAPVPRSEADFDPAAKYHVPADVPYIRYFLSFIGQFQFQKALCKAAGHNGPLHKCDIYKSKEAGDKLMSVLRLGASQPWQDAMEAITGQRDFDASAILEYFKPLMDWLQEQNKNEKIGW